MHRGVGDIQFGFNLEGQRIHIGVAEGIKAFAVANQCFDLHQNPPLAKAALVHLEP